MAVKRKTGSPTIYEVARYAKVSAAAVSLVMNDHDTPRVGAARRKEILRIARSLGYRVNGMAKALIQGQTRIVGLAVPFRDPIFFNQFIAEVLSGIQTCLTERGYHLMIYSHGNDTGHLTRGEIAQTRYVDGVIVLNTRMCSRQDMLDTASELQKARVPFVMANCDLGSQSSNYVGIDDFAVGELAANYLIERGHRTIGMLNGAKRNPMGPALASGFRLALKKHRLSVDPKLHAYSEYDRGRVARTIESWLSHSPRPTAIFCSDDQIVPEVYSVLRSAKLNIPRDIAVLGRGNLSLIANLAPELSTIAIPAFHIGKQSAELLIDSLNAPDAPTQRILLPCTLIRRQSA